jgi:hypothetical protein
MEFVSIGPWCITAELLIKNNLRLKAYPFDYIFSSLEIVKHCINDKFNIFLDKSYYYNNGSNDTSTRHSLYCKMLDTDILYKHHIKNGYPTSYKVSSGNLFNHHNMFIDGNYAKFKRRCERLIDLINSDNKIAFVYHNSYTDNFDDIIDFQTAFSNNKNIYIVGIFENRNEKKILYESSNCKIYQNYNHADIFNEINLMA